MRFTHRFFRYLIGGSIAVLLFICYIGYRAYQKQEKFEDFMSKTQEFQDSIDKDTKQPEGEALAQNDQPSPNPQGGRTQSPQVKAKTFLPDKDWEENIMVDKSKSPVIVTPEDMVKQRIRTPDGKIHTIYVPRGHQVKEGATLSESFLRRPPPFNREELNKGGRIRKSDIPEGEDIETYIHKTILARAYGVSIEDVERMIESGTIQLPKVIAKSVDEFSVDEFMDHDHPLQSKGEVKHLEKTPWGVGNTNSSGGISDDSQSQSPTSVSSSEAVSDVPKMPASPTVSYEGLSPARLDKAQQLIDQYGTEEGLRRLREMDPEAARRFEQERRLVPSRDVPDEGQSESESKN